MFGAIRSIATVVLLGQLGACLGCASAETSAKLHALVLSRKRAEAVSLYRQTAGQGSNEALLRRLALSVMEASLEAHDPALRLAALHGIRHADARSLLRAMFRRLSDPDPDVRSWAAVALSGSPPGARALSEALKSASPRARAVASGELGRIAARSALPALKKLAEDSDARVRAAVARSLASLPARVALPLLLRLIADGDATVRWETTRSLGRLDTRKTPAIKQQAAHTLFNSLNDGFLGVRLAAVEALGQLWPHRVAERLRPLVLDQDRYTALRAAHVLAKAGETHDLQPWLNQIALALRDRNRAVRLAAIAAATSPPDNAALALVSDALHDVEPSVRLAAASLLLAKGRRDSPILRTTASLVSLACDKNRWREPTTAPLCLDACAAALRGGMGTGYLPLMRIVKGNEPLLRRRALGLAMTQRDNDDRNLAKRVDLALDAIASAHADLALDAALWLYRRTK
jgi:HEAT repeat protein